MTSLSGGLSGCTTLAMHSPSLSGSASLTTQKINEPKRVERRFVSSLRTKAKIKPSTLDRMLPSKVAQLVPQERRQAEPKFIARGGRTLTARKSAVTATQISLPPSTQEDILAVGFASIAAQGSADTAQRRLMAARASRMDAYRNLAEQIYGVTYSGESVLDDNKLSQDSMRTRISGLLTGVELVSMEPLGNDTYQTTIRLPGTQVELLRQRTQQ